jgi:23S rRNA (uracil1939-C5)-methyltransferase
VRKDEVCSVQIQTLNAKGWGVAGSVAVVGAVPGDQLKVQLKVKRRTAWRAELLEILTPSLERVSPLCAHAPLCGGCTWQQIAYSAQLQEKQQRVERLFPPSLCRPILPALSPFYYRNKMEFSFSQNKAGERFLGLVLAGTRGYVFNLTECHLVSSWWAELLSSVRAWWMASRLAAYRLDGTGALRTLTVREGKNTGDQLVLLTVSGNPAYALRKEELQGFVKAVQSVAPAASIFLQIQQSLPGSPTQFFEMHLAGKDHLKETLQINGRSLQFKISPTSFFQPNTAQAERLYEVALKEVSCHKKRVLDLYAGTATLGIVMAGEAEHVTSIEINPHACFDAESNKELNALSNLEILCGDVGELLGTLKERPDLVVLDPPRCGLSPAAISHLIALNAPEILYISCNPETQAANIQELTAAGYSLVSIQPVDQFPHTPHIETIAHPGGY